MKASVKRTAAPSALHLAALTCQYYCTTISLVSSPLQSDHMTANTMRNTTLSNDSVSWKNALKYI